MARVVQRRTPPYLLILFVILFVFAAGVAVLLFFKWDTAQTQYDKLAKQQRKVINSSQMRRDSVQQMLREYERTRGETVPRTVVGQLLAQVDTLANRVTGMAQVSFEEAQKKIAETYASAVPGTKRGLVEHLEEYYRKLSEKDTQIARLRSERSRLTDQLKSAREDYQVLQDEMDQKLAQKNQQITALTRKFEQFENDQNQKLTDVKKEYEDSVAELNKKIKEQAGAVQKQDRTIAVLKAKVEDLESKSGKRKPVDTERVVYRWDGKVRRVLPEDGLVYVNIGSKDRVTEGLRLTVYPYTGIPESGIGKAIIEVTNVGTDVSEARIIDQKEDEPVVPGDVVANLVYDSLRTYSFVVEGAFDVDDTGTPTMAGNKAIRDLVRRYGGEVVSEVTPSTDYVILGDSPQRPTKPADTDPQRAWDLYQERLKAYNRFQSVKKVADDMDIPRLGGQRFLDLIGYVPTKIGPTGK